MAMEMEKEDNEDQPGSNIKFIRMNTGEDLISEITEIFEDDGESLYYMFHNPLKIIYVPGERPGHLALHFIQWVFSSVCTDQSFAVFPGEVITIGNPNEQLVEYYQSFIGYYNKKEPDVIKPRGMLKDDIDKENISEDVKKQVSDWFNNLANKPDKNKMN